MQCQGWGQWGTGSYKIPTSLCTEGSDSSLLSVLLVQNGQYCEFTLLSEVWSFVAFFSICL